MTDDDTKAPEGQPLDFIRKIIQDDLTAGRHEQVVTRFPPEPNGYLHIGHAKALCLSFGVAAEFGGRCWLRFDDTNPLKEEEHYVQAIKRDLKWLGFDWQDRLSFASDYFQKLYAIAETLIKQDLAYVDSQSQEEIRRQRGTLTNPGQNSAYRSRSIAENLDLFRQMRAGAFAESEHVLRAKIDMAHSNINMRDPVLYRIRQAVHQRTGDAWCIYPMYDYTHALCDAFEGITHSLCSLEFENHRPLYEWMLKAANVSWHPRQIEFSRLQLEYTVLSKRQLNLLVEGEHVTGWDDPRMPTLASLRRRGVPAQAVIDFCTRTGVTKKQHTIEMTSFEYNVRKVLENETPRAFAVTDPLLLIIDNWSDVLPTQLMAPWHPNKPELGARDIAFGPELYIERNDFMLDPPKGYSRLSPNADVRLRYAYIVHCGEPELDGEGNIKAVHCTLHENSRSGEDSSGVKVKSVIHWLSATTAVPALLRLYDRLFQVPDPGRADDFVQTLNPDSLVLCEQACVEPATMGVSGPVQFERTGYFVLDQESTDDRPVFNRIVALRDTWANKRSK